MQRFIFYIAAISSLSRDAKQPGAAPLPACEQLGLQVAQGGLPGVWGFVLFSET